MQRTAAVLLLCAVASINAQYLNPYMNVNQAMGMGSTWGPPMYRPTGYMQSNHLSSMGYPTWRTHPLFRMAAVNTDKNLGVNLPQDIINVPKVPGAQEVLTHVALVNQNVKPMYDTISDIMYDPQKARQAILTPVYLQGVNSMRTHIPDDCGPLEGAKYERGYSDWVY